MGNIISTIRNLDPHMKLIMFTPFLYPKNIGFTRWNFTNMVISLLYPKNDTLDKFNANNSSAILFGTMIYYLTNRDNFYLWLKKWNISHSSEKIGHFLPFLYYFFKGKYNTYDFDMGMVSLMYEILWSSWNGKSIINKEDLYYPVKYHVTWYLVWIFATWGHFFTVDNISTPKLLTKLPRLSLHHKN